MSAMVAVGAAATAGGCHRGGGTGDDDDVGGDTDGSEGSGTEGGSSSDDGPAACAEALGENAAPLRRLTHWEYDNTIRDLLGDDSQPANAFPTDASATGFDNQAKGQGITPMLAEEYMRAAEDIAARAVQDVDALLPCEAGAGEGEAACAQAFIEQFGMRAYRRPLTDAEMASLYTLYEDGNAAYGFDKAIELLLQTMLQSPKFLYRVEVGMPSDGGAAPLTDWEMASRLSYFLWGTMPDEVLFDAAAEGALHSADEVAAQAERMLDDPRARVAVANFHRQWLQLDDLDRLQKDPTTYPEFDAQLAASMKRETVALLEHVVFDGAGDLDTMLTADYGFVDAALADLYGVSGVQGDELVRVDLDPTQRAGLLTQASLLALTGKPDQSSPVQRGKFVRERLLCDALPEPPPGVDTTPPTVDPDATTRERFDQHSSDPTCAACHVLIDPIGFGFEHYDGIGRWRAMDGDAPVDASGEIVGMDDGAFDGAIELSELLAGSEDVRACFVNTWFTYAHGRAPVEEDTCTTDQLAMAFDDAGHDVRSLLVALTRTEAFLYRPSIGAE